VAIAFLVVVAAAILSRGPEAGGAIRGSPAGRGIDAHVAIYGAAPRVTLSHVTVSTKPYLDSTRGGSP
jgi:hypothetical protein